jgi:hypothetical protein
MAASDMHLSQQKEVIYCAILFQSEVVVCIYLLPSSYKLSVASKSMDYLIR